MIQAFVEKNRRLLRFCSYNIRSIGLIYIALSAVGILVVALQIARSVQIFSTTATMSVGEISVIIRGISGILLGILILGLSDIFKYLLNPSEQKIGWILRRGDLIIYAYAAAITLSTIFGTVAVVTNANTNPNFDFNLSKLVIYSSTLLFAMFKIFVLVCVAPLVRRVVPLIEESMTLV